MGGQDQQLHSYPPERQIDRDRDRWGDRDSQRQRKRYREEDREREKWGALLSNERAQGLPTLLRDISLLLPFSFGAIPKVNEAGLCFSILQKCWNRKRGWPLVMKVLSFPHWALFLGSCTPLTTYWESFPAQENGQAVVWSKAWLLSPHLTQPSSWFSPNNAVPVSPWHPSSSMDLPRGCCSHTIYAFLPYFTPVLCMSSILVTFPMMQGLLGDLENLTRLPNFTLLRTCAIWKGCQGGLRNWMGPIQQVKLRLRLSNQT